MDQTKLHIRHCAILTTFSVNKIFYLAFFYGQGQDVLHLGQVIENTKALELDALNTLYCLSIYEEQGMFCSIASLQISNNLVLQVFKSK